MTHETQNPSHEFETPEGIEPLTDDDLEEVSGGWTEPGNNQGGGSGGSGGSGGTGGSGGG